jgi:hypothetical protein
MSYRKTHGLSTQFFFIRVVLAAALAWGLGSLPKAKQPEA